MVVGIKPAQKKTEDEEKKLPDFVSVETPVTRKKKALCGSVVLLAAVVMVAVVVIGISIAGYFGHKAAGKKRAHIECGTDWDYRYDSPHLHGRRWCDKRQRHGEHHEEHQEEFYDDFMGIINGETQAGYDEYITETDGIYYLEVEGRCEAPKSYVAIDTNNDYTVIKAKFSPHENYHCMLIRNDAFLTDIQTESLEDFDYARVSDGFDLQIRALFSHFFQYGEPVPQSVWADLAPLVHGMCPEYVHFYYLVSGDESFRSQVADLMEAHQITYDDVFYSFRDVYEAFTELDTDGLRSALDDFLESVFFLPDGFYEGQTTPSGIGWSLNINTTSFYDMEMRTYSLDADSTMLPPTDDAADAMEELVDELDGFL